MGVWYNRPFNNDFTLDKREIAINAEPYFFSDIVTETPTLEYTWSVNGKPTQNYGRAINLVNETGAKGDIVVALDLYSPKKTFQSASRNILIHFTGGEINSRPTF